MIEFWRNIYHTVRLQKWRSLMTAFGVFWGILILVVIMGVGRGMDQGYMGQMLRLPYYIEMYANPTSREYKGFALGRNWSFDDKGADILLSKYAKQVRSVGRLCVMGDQLVCCNGRASHYEVQGINPDYVPAYPQVIVSGRGINQTDLDQRRKVCVLGDEVADFFGAEVGGLFKVNDAAYMIVGITHCTNKMYAEEKNPSAKVFLPITTAQLAFGYGTKFDAMVIFTRETASAVQCEPELLRFIREFYGIHPDDTEALQPFNCEQFVIERSAVNVGFNFILWLVGIGTLAAGLIGITNIMLVSVKERTQEIGVYRAIGAQPKTIIKMILAESLFLTLSAGVLGLAAGIYLVAALRQGLSYGAAQDQMVANPYVPVGIALISLLVLVAGGVLAGYFPVRNALKVKPIDALRSE